MNAPLMTTSGSKREGVRLSQRYLIISARARKIGGIIETYGAVSLDELTASLERIPGSFRPEIGAPVMKWSTGVPKIGLSVKIRLLLKGPGTPTETSAGAWTAAKLGDDLCYLTSRFRLGVDDYEDRIKEAVEIIHTELEALNTFPKFDFDEEKTRFEEAEFGVNYFLRKAHV